MPFRADLEEIPSPDAFGAEPATDLEEYSEPFRAAGEAQHAQEDGGSRSGVLGSTLGRRS